jgi:hypothetical protein
LGKPKEESQNIELLKLASLISPFDSEIRYLYGLALLKENQQSLHKGVAQKSINSFKIAIGYNILNYNAYLMLGKAMLSPSITEPTTFEDAIKAFKRAAQIRGINKSVSLDTLKLFISLWPLLNESDQAFCKDLLERSINRLSREEFKGLIEIWTLYSRDVTFMEDILKRNPRYYYTVANELKKKEILLKNRQAFLSQYEVYILTNTLKDFSNLPKGDQDLFNKLNRLKRVLLGNIQGYYKLTENSEFNEKRLTDLLVRLNREIVKHYFTTLGQQNNPYVKFKIEPVVVSIINNLTTLDELDRFNDYLTKNKFYQERDLKRFYLKQLVNFQSGQFDAVINEIEDFRKDVSYVRKENMADFSAIMLLLSDSYVAERLLTKALPVLRELEENSPDLTGIFWRMMRIENVIGEDTQDNNVELKKKKYREIQESRFILLNRLRFSSAVYLVDSKEMEVDFSDSVKEKIKTGDYHILQVFVNDLILYEAYLNGGNLELPIKIPITDSEDVSLDGYRMRVIVSK